MGLVRCWMYQGPRSGTVLLLGWGVALNTGLVASSVGGEGVMVTGNLCIASAWHMAIPAEEHKPGVWFNTLGWNMKLPLSKRGHGIEPRPALGSVHTDCCTLVPSMPLWAASSPSRRYQHGDCGYPTEMMRCLNDLSQCKSRVRYQH